MPVAVRWLTKNLSRLSHGPTTAKRKSPYRQCTSTFLPARTFTSASWRLEATSPDGNSGQVGDSVGERNDIILEDLNIEDLDKYSPIERAELRANLRILTDPSAAGRDPIPRIPIDEAKRQVKNIIQATPMLVPSSKVDRRREPGLLEEDEEDEFAKGPDEELNGEDMTSIAHSELDLHRDMREYQRRVAWDMPLLNSQFPYFPPRCFLTSPLTLLQNLPNPLSCLQQHYHFASAIQPTWGSTTQQPAKSLSTFARLTSQI
jgi:hypothetical protein